MELFKNLFLIIWFLAGSFSYVLAVVVNIKRDVKHYKKINFFEVIFLIIMGFFSLFFIVREMNKSEINDIGLIRKRKLNKILKKIGK